MPTVDFGIRTDRLDSHTAVVNIEGDLDLYRAPEFAEALTSLITRGWYHLVVNLGKVTFIDTTGVGVLIGAHKRVKEWDGSITVVNTSPRFMKILQAIRLAPIFQIFETLEDALSAVRADETLLSAV